MAIDNTIRRPPPPVLGPQSGAKDVQTVTSQGDRVGAEIAGVIIRPAIVHADERGELTELLSQGWDDVDVGPIPHVYLATVGTGVVKGWVCHRVQDDRSIVLFGRLRWVLYDGRAGSPTAGLVQAHTLTERNRHLIVVPAGVWHAVQNVGETEACFVNMPTRAYTYDDPDKYRLPMNSPEIPFSFHTP